MNETYDSMPRDSRWCPICFKNHRLGSKTELDHYNRLVNERRRQYEAIDQDNKKRISSCNSTKC